MTKPIIKSQLFPCKNDIKIKLELSDTTSSLPKNLQTFKQKSLSGIGLIVYKGALKISIY